MDDKLVTGFEGSGINPMISIVDPEVTRHTTAPGTSNVCPVTEETNVTVPTMSFPWTSNIFPELF